MKLSFQQADMIYLRRRTTVEIMEKRMFTHAHILASLLITVYFTFTGLMVQYCGEGTAGGGEGTAGGGTGGAKVGAGVGAGASAAHSLRIAASALLVAG